MADAKLEQKLERLLDRLEILLPKTEDEVDWSAAAFRWRRKQYLGMSYGVLEPIHRVALVDPDSIKNADQQKAALLRNTEQFVRGLPANNVLLTGARGTGKSSLIRACLKQFADQGLRLIEVDKEDLKDLIDIAQRIADRPEKFIVFCDDLSFEFGEGGYKALKAILDGSVASTGDNLLVYATSNRRHLMPEKMQDNLASSMDEDGELHPAETIEEKMSLSERFGLWLSFYPFSQKEYLAVAEGWTKHFGGEISDRWQTEALQFALQRGSRSAVWLTSLHATGQEECIWRLSMTTKPTEVVVAVAFDKDGRFLMTSRPEGKVYAGYWEFPGGKVEAGETLEEALVREMKEELGVQVTDCRGVYSTVFTYPHATVHLHFLHCRLNPEELKCLEGQTYRFCTLEDLPHPILPATEPVLAQVTARK